MIKLSPSGATRWSECPGSLITKGFDQVEQNYAQEGTMAHALAEHCLKEDISPFDVESFDYENYGVEYKDAEPSDEMVACVDGYIDFVQSIISRASFYEIESRHKLFITEGVYLQGLSDFSAYVPGEYTFHIVDLKYGMGTPVSATKNKQLMCYGLLAYYKCLEKNPGLKPTTIALHVYQPRDLYGLRDDPLDSYYMSLDELMEYFRSIVQLGGEIKRGKTPHKIGEYCRWCKGLSCCPKVYGEIERISKLGETKMYSSKDLSIALSLIKVLSRLEETVKGEAISRLQSGKSVENFKLVKGNGLRRYVDENEAEEILVEKLGERAYTKKLLTVAKAEKELGKGKIDELWVKLPGKNRIAHVSEKGKPVVMSAEDVLNDLM